MDPIIEKSLRAVKAGHQGILPGFGLELLIVNGPPSGPLGRQWQDRLVITGRGVAEFHSIRPMSDGSGEPAGLFRGAVSLQDLAEVVDAVEATGLVDEAPFRIEPSDMNIRVSIIVGGMHVVKYIGVKEPGRLERLQPLFERLQRIEAAVRGNPVRTLKLEMSVAEMSGVGVQVVPVMLRFINQGTEPYWIPHPRGLNLGPYHDRATLSYGRGPSPADMLESPLRAEVEAGVQMIWMGSGWTQEIRTVAEVNFHQAGRFVVRATYSTYSGEETVGGVARLRGCVFSAEQMVAVG